MTFSQRIGLLGVAVVMMTAALLLLVTAGLPNRTAVATMGNENGVPIAPEVGAIAPAFELPKPDGEMIALENLRGVPVLINFWATWCGPCRVEMPFLQSVYNEQRANGLRILAVNMGEAENTVGAWVTQNNLTFDIVLDQDESIARMYRLRGQPSTYVVGPDGIISHIFYGPVTQSALRAALEPFDTN